MLYISADDYGVSATACRHIAACASKRKLNKISVFTNSVFAEDKEIFLTENIELSLHINLVEGHALENPKKIPLLVHKDGRFKHSFEGLLFLSLSPKRKEFKEQVYCEMKAQIKHWQESLPAEAPLALDSHQHPHMIPLVFTALMELIRDERLPVKYIRYPAEPLLPYLKTPSLYLTYNPVNVIKQWLLGFCGVINRKKLRASGIKTAYFMGILFSGKMDGVRVKKILPHYVKLAEKHKADIELLFHPGYSDPSEIVFDEKKKSFKKFYFSKGRRIEFDTVMNLEV